MLMVSTQSCAAMSSGLPLLVEVLLLLDEVLVVLELEVLVDVLELDVLVLPEELVVEAEDDDEVEVCAPLLVDVEVARPGRRRCCRWWPRRPCPPRRRAPPSASRPRPGDRSRR